MLDINRVYCGDCLDILPQLDLVDAVITDPPYGLSFMGKNWDHGVPGVVFWEAILDRMKPGAHLLAFGGTRTHHRLMVAIEDAGFEIRDVVMWVYGSGFPKSLDVSKAIDKAAGVERVAMGLSKNWRESKRDYSPEAWEVRGENAGKITVPLTDAAKQWEGWGTALKPAYEPIILARKPLDGTVANNVLTHGVGGLNIDESRVGTEIMTEGRAVQGSSGRYQWNVGEDSSKPLDNPATHTGRWPANFIHDGSDEVVELFPDTKPTKPHGGDGKPLDTRNQGWGFTRQPSSLSDKGGSAARFFYCAKASKKERGEDNKHPTVKPLALMQYLCNLITPPNGVILDPFAGSGTTGIAAINTNHNYVLIEKEPQYIITTVQRLEAAKEAQQFSP